MRQAGLRAPLRKITGPIYGKLGGPRSRADYITSSEIPHSLIAAPTGSGKGVGVVIPTLLTYPGSVICLDVKGENFARTARRRASIGDKVYKFAPYDPEGRTHRFNPLEDVAAAHPRRRFTEARRLAASLIVAHGNGQGFLDGARELFAATALLAIERGTPTIGAIFDALSQPGEAFKVLRELGDEAKSEEARKIFYKMSGMESRILSSYLSVLADGGLSLWADPAVRDATATSDFSIQTLRSTPASIFIVVAPNDLVPLAPLIRLMFQQTIAILQRTEPKKEKGESFPVLFLLDEFVSLGRMDVLSSAITTLRSYGGRVMIVVQTIASLRDLYGKEGAATFLANCRMQLFMAPADEETPTYISNAVGDYTRNLRSKSWKSGEFATSIQERVDAARLMRPEQVRMLGGTRIVALVQNMYPVLAHRVTYYEDRELKRIFEAQTGDLPEPPSLFDEAPSEQIGAGLGPQVLSVRSGEAVESAKRGGKEPASPPSRSTDDMDDATEREVYSGLGEVAADQAGVLGEIATALSEAARRNRERFAVRSQEADEQPVESEACSAEWAGARTKGCEAALPTDSPADKEPDLSDVLRDAQLANRVRSEV